MDDFEKAVEEQAAARRAQAIRDEQNAELQARIAAKRQAEYELSIREGWLNADGSVPGEDDEDTTNPETEDDGYDDHSD